MIVYSVTIQIRKHREEEWLRWALEEHIPAVMHKGAFQAYRFHKLLSQDDPNNPTYNILYYARDIRLVNQYLEQDAALLNQEQKARFGQDFLAYRTLFEELASGAAPPSLPLEE